MGGWGSGRRDRPNKKPVVDQFSCLDVATLAEALRKPAGTMLMVQIGPLVVGVVTAVGGFTLYHFEPKAEGLGDLDGWKGEGGQVGQEGSRNASAGLVVATEGGSVGGSADGSSEGAEGGGRTLVETWIEVGESKCGYGGTQLWLVCPDCRTKRRKLYNVSPTAASGGLRLTCHQCHGMTYRVVNEDKQQALARAMRKVEARIAAMGAEAAQAQGPADSPDSPEARAEAALGLSLPNRPRGMRRKTYERLTDRYTDLVLARIEAECARLAQVRDMTERHVTKHLVR